MQIRLFFLHGLRVFFLSLVFVLLFPSSSHATPIEDAIVYPDLRGNRAQVIFADALNISDSPKVMLSFPQYTMSFKLEAGWQEINQPVLPAATPVVFTNSQGESIKIFHPDILDNSLQKALSRHYFQPITQIRLPGYQIESVRLQSPADSPIFLYRLSQNEQVIAWFQTDGSAHTFQMVFQSLVVEPISLIDG